MKRRATLCIAALLLAFVAIPVVASAQNAVTAVIDFTFVAGGKVMAPGKYIIDAPMDGPVVLRGATGSSGLMPIVTTLGRHDLDKDPELVFDKVDGRMLLSEVWLPGQDGLLVLSTKGPHEHAVVGGSNPRK